MRTNHRSVVVDPSQRDEIPDQDAPEDDAEEQGDAKEGLCDREAMTGVGKLPVQNLQASLKNTDIVIEIALHNLKASLKDTDIVIEIALHNLQASLKNTDTVIELSLIHI